MVVDKSKNEPAHNAEAIKDELKVPVPDAQNPAPEIRVITIEQLLVDNLNCIFQHLNDIEAKIDAINAKLDIAKK